MVDVEQRTLCAFKQQIGAALVGVVKRARHIGNHFRQARRDGHGAVVDLLEVDGR